MSFGPLQPLAWIALACKAINHRDADAQQIDDVKRPIAGRPPKSRGRFSYLVAPARVRAIGENANERIPETPGLFLDKVKARGATSR